jgi:hypothetical protein
VQLELRVLIYIWGSDALANVTHRLTQLALASVLRALFVNMAGIIKKEPLGKEAIVAILSASMIAMIRYVKVLT